MDQKDIRFGYVMRMLEKALGDNQGDTILPLPVHLKIDTGMHRLGFDPSDVENLTERLARKPGLHVQSVFSHLAASEDPAEDEFTLQQIGLLKNAAAKIQAGLGYPVLAHILNSAGISRFPDAQMGMVRLGIGLYGVGFNEAEQNNLRNVSTLKTIISQIRKVKAGDTIGYNRKGVAKRDMLIAILPIGYADGFSRRLGNGAGKVMINGKPAPTIGNISMDTCMVDVTDLAGSGDFPAIQEGDEVIIFGDVYPISRFARNLGTIPYEVLTSISRRVKRVYFLE